MKNSSILITKIISGGQTGVDQAALDAAIALGIKHGGWCPKNRLNEKGRIPKFYNLKETSSTLYQQRTSLNIKQADSTLIIIKDGKWGKGTELTKDLCEIYSKKYLIIDKFNRANQIKFINWINETNPNVLNIAGNRESTSPGIYNETVKFLLSTLSNE